MKQKDPFKALDFFLKKALSMTSLFKYLLKINRGFTTFK